MTTTSTLTRRNLDSLAIGPTTLRWHQIPTGHDGGTGWLHSGIAISPTGELLVAHPEGRDLLKVGTDGTTRVQTPLTELHCITSAIADDGVPIVWVADNGHRFVCGTPSYDEITAPGRIVALTLDGAVVRELTAPSAPGPWSPTSVTPTDPSDPRSDIWVADGYGQSLVHRYTADGALELTIDGTESGTAFDCPYGILVRTHGTTTELYVADRANRRIVVFGLDGTYLRTIGVGALDSPSSMTDYAGNLVVTELFGALAIFEGDVYTGHIGSAGRDHSAAAWPNEIDANTGNTVAPRLSEGVFNSPHGIVVGNGALYLTEWMIGGRIVQLAPTEGVQKGC